ncbi:MAG TPA: hypothetical protein VGF88_23635 [Acidobacteriaceae bacterium]|jgi:hypothetical protein
MPNGIVIQIQGDGAGAAEALRTIEEKMRQSADAGREMGATFGEVGERIQRALEYTGIYFGIREMTEGMKDAISSAAEFGETIEHAALKTGMSAQTLSVLHYAADLTGSDFEQLVKGATRLGKTLSDAADGNQRLSLLFQSMGINAKDLASRSDGVEIALRKIAERLQEGESPARLNQQLMEAMGRSGSELAPVLVSLAEHFDEFAAGAKEAGVYMDDLSAGKLMEVNEQIKQLKESWTGLTLELTESFAPAIKAALQDFSGLLQITRESPVGSMKAFLGSALGIPSLENSGISDLVKAHDAAMNAVSNPTKPTKYGDTGTEMDPTMMARLNVQLSADRRQLDEAKAASEAMLAILQAQHSAGLVSTQAFYAEKLGIEEDAIQAEMRSLIKERDQIASAAKSAPSGSSQQYEMKAKLNQVESQLDQLQERRRSIEGTLAAEKTGALQTDALAQLRLETETSRAAIEFEKNKASVIMALLDSQHEEGLLSDREFYNRRLSIQQDALDAEAAAIGRQAAELDAQQRQLPADSPKQIQLKEQQVQLETELQRLSAEYAKNESDAAEAQSKSIQQSAAILASTKRHATGGSGDNEDAKYLKTQGYDMATSETQDFLHGIEDLSGKHPLQRLVDNMIQDLDRYADAIIEHEFIGPMLQQIFGLNSLAAQNPGWLQSLNASTAGLQTQSPDLTETIPGFSDGGEPDGLSMVGEAGPELFMPKGPGTILPNDLLNSIAGGGGAPNVTINNVNNSSSPVTMKAPQVSYDAQAKQFVIQTVIEDMQGGGPMSQALRTG